MTYEEAIEFWFGRINFEVKSARPQDLKLERMRAFLARLGNPQDRLRIVHVTGTKGKGSTSAMLAEVLQCAGYRVGLFTSPHLVDVEERIQVDRVCISRYELVTLIEEIAPVVHDLEHSAYQAPTFFEIGTALGFLHFLRRRVEIAIVEVGLGGRFDSTNVCRPLASVITSIGFDHTAQLGNTLEAITYQKAGIIKPRVPVVSGVSQQSCVELIRQIARELDAPVDELNRDFFVKHLPATLEGALPRFQIRTRSIQDCFELKLLGVHQSINAAVAVATLDRLKDAGLSIPRSAIAQGLSRVAWPARIECIRSRPWVILDSAHNVPSAKALIATLGETLPSTAGKKTCIFAVSSDKQYEEILEVLSGYFDQFVLTKYGKNPRCVHPEKLAELLGKSCPQKLMRITLPASAAWSETLANAQPSDLVCITGSVFLAGELQEQVRSDCRSA